MKNKGKIIIGLLAIIIATITNIKEVHAEGYYTLQDFVLDTEDYIAGGGLIYDYTSAVKNYLHRGFQSVGFLIDEIKDTIGIKNAINSVDSTIDSNSSDEDAYDWVKNNISVSGNSVLFSNDLNSVIKNYSNNYNSNVVSFYSVDVDNINITLNSTQKSFISGLQDSNYVLCDMSSLSDTGTTWRDVCFTVIPYNSDVFVYPVSKSGNFYEGNFVTLSSNGVMVNTKLYGATAYNGNCVEITNNTNVSTFGQCDIAKEDNINTVSSSDIYLVSEGKVFQYYGYAPPFNGSVNTNPFYTSSYYNNTSWDNFEDNSSSDYVVDSNNFNSVSYGDTITYINDYHDTNNNYPDNSTVNNWIENTNIENNTNGGGSGGENGGDDSGGGSSGDGIFDFLSDLGGVLGNLIKNLGQAITNIIKGVADLVESIVTDLPTVFFDFIGAIFGWLPDEWVMLLSLSLACMLIWGIVKVIRG